MEDPDISPPDDMFKLTIDPRKAPDTPEDFSIIFDKGLPVKLNYYTDNSTIKSVSDPLELFLTANMIGRRHGKSLRSTLIHLYPDISNSIIGVGRIDIVEVTSFISRYVLDD